MGHDMIPSEQHIDITSDTASTRSLAKETGRIISLSIRKGKCEG